MYKEELSGYNIAARVMGYCFDIQNQGIGTANFQVAGHADAVLFQVYIPEWRPDMHATIEGIIPIGADADPRHALKEIDKLRNILNPQTIQAI